VDSRGGDCELMFTLLTDDVGESRMRFADELAAEERRRFALGEVGGDGTITADAMGLRLS